MSQTLERGEVERGDYHINNINFVLSYNLTEKHGLILYILCLKAYGVHLNNVALQI